MGVVETFVMGASPKTIPHMEKKAPIRRKMSHPPHGEKMPPYGEKNAPTWRWGWVELAPLHLRALIDGRCLGCMLHNHWLFNSVAM